METSERLQDFVKMWKWLGSHPDNDRDFYLQLVVRNHSAWLNDCPLADKAGEACSGCNPLLKSGKDSLCTDSDSPLRRWQAVNTDDPDLKMYYASQIGALGIQALAKMRQAICD